MNCPDCDSINIEKTDLEIPNIICNDCGSVWIHYSNLNEDDRKKWRKKI